MNTEQAIKELQRNAMELASWMEREDVPQDVAEQMKQRLVAIRAAIAKAKG